MGSILRNNRRMFWEILNRIIGRKKRIGTGLAGIVRAHAPYYAPFMTIITIAPPSDRKPR